jgi:hypothetical protein
MMIFGGNVDYEKNKLDLLRYNIFVNKYLEVISSGF